ncbi:alanine racemase [Butyrivibrio sp. JL13D10]|uniref:alanine racemase n=1 Tax=Butyrivibrio sp. JL13D10 TaxID=3236815 RepID=UPI0038B508A0
MLDTYARVYAKVDLEAVNKNVENMHASLPDGTKMLAVVKANGYGMGAAPIASMVEEKDYIWGFATATAEEAFALRDEGITKPILVLGYTFPYAYKRMLMEGIRPSVFREDMLSDLSKCWKENHKEAGDERFYVHIAVDCGMSRIGIRPNTEGEEFIMKAFKAEGIKVEGIFTHFARADEKNLASARKCFKTFEKFVYGVEEKKGVYFRLKHCCNSAGIIQLREAHMDMVRCGVTMYGMWPSEEVDKEKIQINPVLSMISHVTYVKTIPPKTEVSYGGTFVSDKEMKIATIPVGYADGYPRTLSGGKGQVLISGKRAPVIGRICMDQFMVDVTDIDDVKEGDEVVLIGHGSAADENQESISLEELGQKSGRFNYEFACEISGRVPRIYEKNQSF